MRAYIIEKEKKFRKEELQARTIATLRENQLCVNVVSAGRDAMPGERDIEWLKADVEQMAEDEYCLLIADSICGLVLPLGDLEHRLREANKSMILLVRGGGVVALKKQAFQQMEMRWWISGGMDFEELQGLHLEELYDTEKLCRLTDHPMLDLPAAMIREINYPFFSLDVFRLPFQEKIQTTIGNQAGQLLRVLKEKDYDVDPLIRYLTATMHQSDLLYSLQLIYVLSSDDSAPQTKAFSGEGKKLALGMHLYYMDLIHQSREYAERFPKETDIIITTSDEEKKKIIEREFASVSCRSLDVRVIENKGRDVSALVVGMRDIVDWDLVCYYHDKKTLQTKPGSVGVGFAYQCAENLFASREYVENVVRLFNTEKHLGLLSPPPPNHADYYFTMALPWGTNWDVSFDLYTRLGLTVPLAMDKPPVAPLGTCFWFRGAALRALMEKNWSYDDFPPEPNGTDGTILHAFERMYSFCAQESGYLSAYICSDQFAANLRTSLMHYVRSYNQTAASAGIQNKAEEMMRMVERRIG